MKVLIFVLLVAVALTSGFDLKNIKKFVKPAVTAITNPKILITNGHNARTNQFNFQVGLLSRKNFFTYTWCGGSLISPEWIITAAHCTDGVKSITAYLGSTKQQSGIEVKVLETIIHSKWNSEDVVNDISLLRIAPVPLGPSINIVKLPAVSSSNLLYLNKKVIASGWGNINDEGESSVDLQYANLKIVPNWMCSLAYGYVGSSVICAQGPKGTSTCSGDSGGPLVTESSKILIGLTSFGGESCTEGLPEAYTRISSYRLWILEQTGV